MEAIWNFKIFALVFGGTFACAMVVWSFSLRGLFSNLSYHFFEQKIKPSVLLQDIVLLSRLFPIKSSQIQKVIAGFAHPYLRESANLVADGVYDEKTLERILKTRVDLYFSRRAKHVSKLATLARFPVSIGLCAVIWFMNQGDQTSAALSLFYATSLSYFLILPLADWLAEKNEIEHREWNMISHGMKLVLARTNPVTVAEEMNSFLAPEERVQWVALSLPFSTKAS